MKKRKVCLVGEFSVGKTSLTQKFVNNVFSDKYLTTVGVKIDTVIVKDTKLIIWDIAGRDSLSPINSTYLIGASGVVFVVDGTKLNTLDSLVNLKEVVSERIGKIPSVIAINKCDHEDFAINEDAITRLQENNSSVVITSAKENKNVAELFELLHQLIDGKIE